MKKFIRFSTSVLCAVLVSAAAAVSASAAECGISVPGCGNVSGCVVSLNGCNPCDIQSVLSQNCNNSSCDVQGILSQNCNNSSCDVQSLISQYGCDNTDIQNLIQQCGILPDNSQCAVTNNTQTTAPTVTPPTVTNDNNTTTVTPITPQTTTETTAPTTTDSNGYSVNDYEKQVVQLVNQIRKENGLSELTLNTELSKVARIKAQDMHDNQYFSHTSPTYGSPFDMMKQFGISYRTAGENIAMGQQSPQAVVDAWMNSEGHRANILNSSYTQIGMGYVADGNCWSQMFIG